MIVVQCQPQLPQIIETLSPPRRFASRLNCREKQCRQEANNCDDHEQFDYREPGGVKSRNPGSPAAILWTISPP